MAARGVGTASEHWLLCVGPAVCHAQLQAIVPPADPDGDEGRRPGWVALQLDPAADQSAVLDGLRAAHAHPPLMALLVEPPDSPDPAGRALLAAAGWPYATLNMGDPGWLQQAQTVWAHACLRAAQSSEARQPRWRWVCPDCDDAECERHWLLGGRR